MINCASFAEAMVSGRWQKANQLKKSKQAGERRGRGWRGSRAEHRGRRQRRAWDAEQRRASSSVPPARSSELAAQRHRASLPCLATVSCPGPPPSPSSVVVIAQMLASQSPFAKRTLNFLNPDSVGTEDHAGRLNIGNAGDQVLLDIYAPTMT